MKNYRFLAVMVLLIIFGCSKDEVITTEQDSMVIEENNSSINGEKNTNELKGQKPYQDSRLYTISDSEGGFLENTFDLKILQSGKISGNFKGFGPINQNESNYILSELSYLGLNPEDPSNSTYKYNFRTDGMITLNNSRGTISFTITGTALYKDGNGLYVGPVNGGSGVLRDGTGKFDGLTGTVKWSYINVDQNSGEISSSSSSSNAILIFTFL